MRTYTQLSLSGDYPQTRNPAREAARRLIGNSYWLPALGSDLTEGNLEVLLHAARSDKEGRLHHSLLERKNIVDGLRLTDERAYSLAVNVLFLLTQAKHGMKLEDVKAAEMIPLRNVQTGSWGLIVAESNTANVRVRAESPGQLQRATADLLTLLTTPGEARPSSKSSSDGQPSVELHFQVDGDVLESNPAGELVARGKAHTLIGGGYFRYAAYGRGTKTLFQTMVVLLLLSLVILVVSTLNPALGAEPYFNWGHGVIDRLFTAAAGAWLFATIASYVDLVGAHSKKSARVVITWKYEADSLIH